MSGSSRLPMSAASDVTMKEILKPTPVSVTMPTMMPTVAAAAPTEMAYLAPTTKASTTSTTPALRSPPRHHANMNVATTMAVATAMKAGGNDCAGHGRQDHAAAEQHGEEGAAPGRNDTMQPVMPQNAAR